MATTTPSVPTPTFSEFAKWGVGYGLFAVIMLGFADTDKGNVASAFTWLVAVGATVYWWKPLSAGLTDIFGVNFPATPAGQKYPKFTPPTVPHIPAF